MSKVQAGIWEWEPITESELLEKFTDCFSNTRIDLSTVEFIHGSNWAGREHVAIKAMVEYEDYE